MAAVIDASVAIKWFVLEKGRTEALNVLHRVLLLPEQFCVPELFYFELSHVFNRIVPNATKVQLNLMETVLQLGMNRFSFGPDLFRGQRKFQKLGLSGYDATYVALAEQIKGQWLTFDSQAYKKIAHTKLCKLL